MKKIEKKEIPHILLYIIIGLLVIYLFLIGVNVLQLAINLLGGDFSRKLYEFSTNPFVGLFAGILGTALSQSSSVTTSVIVGMVSTDALSMGGAVPMMMGANIGTSVTNTLVSLGLVKQPDQFKKAFAAATIHDCFNILSVLIILPLELMTGILQKSGEFLAFNINKWVTGSATSPSPLHDFLKPTGIYIKDVILNLTQNNKTYAGVLMIVLAFMIIVSTLLFIVKKMNSMVKKNQGVIIYKLLSRNVFVSILFGILLTIAVQSSSVTTSLLIPLAGSGFLTLEVIFPITIGANIGTTATALIASLAGNIHGLAIALVHLLFNLLATFIWYPNKKMRAIPIWCANYLALLISKNKSFSLIYILVVFFILPVTLIYLFK